MSININFLNQKHILSIQSIACSSKTSVKETSSFRTSCYDKIKKKIKKNKIKELAI